MTQETPEQIKAQRDELLAEVERLRVVLKSAHEALLDLHPNRSEKAYYAEIDVRNALTQTPKE